MTPKDPLERAVYLAELRKQPIKELLAHDPRESWPENSLCRFCNQEYLSCDCPDSAQDKADFYAA